MLSTDSVMAKESCTYLCIYTSKPYAGLIIHQAGSIVRVTHVTPMDIHLCKRPLLLLLYIMGVSLYKTCILDFMCDHYSTGLLMSTISWSLTS